MWAVSRLVRFPLVLCVGLCNGTWHREKEQRRKASVVPVHFVQGNVSVASFFVALNFSAGPGWVWRAGEQCLRGPPGRPRSSAGACSSARCQQPLRKGSCGRAVLPGAFVGLLIAWFVVGLGRVPARPSLPARLGVRHVAGEKGAVPAGCLWMLGCSARCSQAAFLAQALWRGSRSWTFAMSWVEGPTLCHVW